jgi:hypothetical protein
MAFGNRRDDLWEQNFAALLKFKRRKGHCCVPIFHREGDLKLGWWVATQRRNQKEMSAERRARFKQNRLCVARASSLSTNRSTAPYQRPQSSSASRVIADAFGFLRQTTAAGSGGGERARSQRSKSHRACCCATCRCNMESHHRPKRSVDFSRLRGPLRLPPSGDVWPETERKLWLQLLEGSFKLIPKDKSEAAN